MTSPEQATLDPQARDLLEVLNGDGSRRLAELSPAEARRRLAKLPDIGPREQPLERVEDRDVPADDGRRIPTRLYASTSGDGLPVLVYIHGGGWVTGDLDVNDFRARRLAARVDCLVVSVDYRLAPEHPFPAASEDAHAILEWALNDAAEVGGDPDRVAIAGDSSGANLAAAATLMARDRRDLLPRLQVLTCPVTDRDLDGRSMRAYGEGYILERADLDWCWRHYLADPADAENAYASPLRAPDLRGLPPALVVTAELDPLRDQGEAYARRLEEAGVRVTLRRYPGMVHSFVDFEGALDAAGRALDECALVLRSAWGDGALPRMEAPTALPPRARRWRA